MKGEILIEFEYAAYSDLEKTVEALAALHLPIDRKRMTISFIDSGDKVFMTESSSPNGE